MASRISSGSSTTVRGSPLMRSRPADLGLVLVGGRVRRADRELDLLRGALADRDAVLAPQVRLDGGVDVEPADADGLERDDAAERDHRHLARATADVDDHVAERLVDRQRRADGGGHRLLDEVGLRRAGAPRRLEHGALLDVRDGGRHADEHTGAVEPRDTRRAAKIRRIRRWVISKSVIAPPRSGRTATMWPGVRPIMCHASWPIASTSWVRLLSAMTVGSLRMMPCPRA